MIQVDLTEKQHANLVEFLQRSTMNGKEVPAYLEIAEALNKPMIELMNPIIETKTDKTDNQS